MMAAPQQQQLDLEPGSFVLRAVYADLVLPRVTAVAGWVVDTEHGVDGGTEGVVLAGVASSLLVGGGAVLALIGIGIGFFRWCVEGRAWAEPWRVQREVRGPPAPPPELDAAAVRQVRGDAVQLIVGTGLLGAALQAWSPWAVDVRPAAVPDDLTALWQLLLTFLLADVWFYCGHRLLHTNRWLYAKVHKVHHRFYRPTAVATNYTHPVESVLNSSSVFGPPCVVGIASPFLFGLWVFISIWESVDAHSGYALPFSPWSLPFFRQSERHYFHHAQNKGMYGVWLTDRLLGTDAAFNKFRAAQTAHSSSSSSSDGGTRDGTAGASLDEAPSSPKARRRRR